LNAVAARLLAAANPTTLDDWPDLAALARGGESELTAVRLPGGACLARARRVRSDIGAPTGVIVALTETRAPSAPAPPPGASFDDRSGSSPAMRKRLRAAATAALRGSHLLIGGEPGTGKRMLAHVIASAATETVPVAVVDCATLPRTRGPLFGRPGVLDLA